VRGFIALEQFQAMVQAMPDCEYRDYLNLVADEYTQPN
jgi:glucose-1-phosphate thymidylyltransferase